MQQITAKQILIPNKSPEHWFDIAWNMNLYRGCNHGCIYCDSRSVCYHVEHFDEMEVKINALEILRNELLAKKRVATIGTGSMSDPYNHYEEGWQYTRRALKLLSEHGFPIHINTKGTLILRDTDILSEIHKQTMASVAISFSTPDDELARAIEPHAPLPSERLMTMRKLSDYGIYTGILYTPLLPYITDISEQVTAMVRLAAEHGARYILCWFGMTLREGSREIYYQALQKHFPAALQLYRKYYDKSYVITSHHAKNLNQIYQQTCSEYGLLTSMRDILTYEKLCKREQLSIFEDQ